MTADLSGRVVAITGATSGIGAATARAFVAAGACVALGGRRADLLQGLRDELGDKAIAVRTDVRRPDDTDQFMEAAVVSFGALDVVVANAGIGMYGGIMDHTNQELAEMMDVNFAGTVWTIRSAIPHLRDGRGDIVIVSSVAGLRGRGNEAVYAGTKHAQVGFAGALDRQLFGQGVRVTTMCPGGVVTEFAMAPGAGRTSRSPELADMMQPADVADAIISAVSQPPHVRSLIWSLRGATEED